MIQTVKKFEKLSLSIKEYMDESNYKTKFFIGLLGLSNATFYRKLKEHSFTVEEIVKLSEHLFQREHYEFQLKESIRQGREDYKNGNVIDAREHIAFLRKKYL